MTYITHITYTTHIIYITHMSYITHTVKLLFKTYKKNFSNIVFLYVKMRNKYYKKKHRKNPKRNT